MRGQKPGEWITLILETPFGGGEKALNVSVVTGVRVLIPWLTTLEEQVLQVSFVICSE